MTSQPLRALMGKDNKVLIVAYVDADLFGKGMVSVSRSRKQLFYARMSMIIDGKRVRRYVHREILERKLGRPLTKDEVVDHINNNGLDNRRKNLRAVTEKQNLSRRGPSQRTRHGVKGVWQYATSKRWAAEILVNGVKHRLGCFATIEQAAAAYDAAVLKHFGPLAYRNNLPVR